VQAESQELLGHCDLLLPAPLRRDLAPHSNAVCRNQIFSVDVTRHRARLSIVVSAFNSGVVKLALAGITGGAMGRARKQAIYQDRQP